MKGFHNELHGGQQANSIVDWMLEWGFLQKTFKKKAEDNKWSSSDLSAWQSRQLATFQGSATAGLKKALVGWKTLNDISAVVNYVRDKNLFEKLEEFYNLHVDPSTQYMSNMCLLRLWHSMRKLVIDTLAPDVQSVVWFEIIKRTLPSEHAVPELCKQDLSAAMAFVTELLTLPMTNSKAVKMMEQTLAESTGESQPAPADEDEDDDEAQEPTPAKRRKVGAKVGAKQKRKPLKVSAKTIGDNRKKDALQMLAHHSKPKDEMQWDHDVGTLAIVAVGSCAEKEAQEAKHYIVDACFDFAFSKVKTFGSKNIDKYNEFRLAALHAMRSQNVASLSGPQIAQALMQSTANDGCAPNSSSVLDVPAAADFVQKNGIVGAEVAFKLLPAVLALNNKIHGDKAFALEVQTMTAFALEVPKDAVRAAVHTACEAAMPGDIAKVFISIIREIGNGTVSDNAKTIFHSESQETIVSGVTLCMQLRTKLALHALLEMFDGGLLDACPVKRPDATAITTLRDKVCQICDVEGAMDVDGRVHLWTCIINGIARIETPDRLNVSVSIRSSLDTARNAMAARGKSLESTPLPGSNAIVPAADAADAVAAAGNTVPMPTPKQGGQAATLANVLVFRALGYDVDLITIRRLCISLELYLHMVLLQRFPCAAWSNVEVSIDPARLSVTSEAAFKNLCLPAVGEVTVVPQQHGAKLCTVKGIDFHLIFPKGAWTSMDTCNPYVAVMSQLIEKKNDAPLMLESHEDVQVYIDEHGDVHSTTVQGAVEATIRIPMLVHNEAAQVKAWPARLTVSKIRQVKPTAAAVAALAQSQQAAPSSKTLIQSMTDGTVDKKAAKLRGDSDKALFKRWAHLLS